MTQNLVLIDILNQVRKSTSRKHLLVFDLDSTLFDVGPRLDRILSDYSTIPEHKKMFPDQIELIAQAKVARRDWGFKEALVRAGLDGNHPELQESVREFWQKTFFSNEYLDYDIPYPGAVEYCQALAEAGAKLIYLTGRDVARMGKGSEQVLKKWNFPLDEHKHQLILKPHKEMDDAEFKRDWFADLKTDEFEKIIFFENEPVNIHLIRKSLPHIQIVFFDSTHSRAAHPPEDVPSVMHFLLEELGEH